MSTTIVEVGVEIEFGDKKKVGKEIGLMLRRSIFGLALARRSMATMASQSQTPMEDIMRAKVVQSSHSASTSPPILTHHSQITTALQPTKLEIHNDSHLHSHHKAMAGSTSSETHFRVVITSDVFKGKMQPARHRMVYGLLKEEMAKEGGIHALQLRTKTVEEEEKAAEREREEREGRTEVEGVSVE